MSHQHVVVIGYGMAAARLIEEIRRGDPDGRHIAITVIGEEPVHAYNRLLLTKVLTEAMTAETISLQNEDWVTGHRIRLILGVAVSAVDRSAREIALGDGERIGYDVLVFATGSRPWVPPTEGLLADTGKFADGVVAFRSLADCESVMKHAEPGVEVAVLGGGVLGLEVARALVDRTGHVTVVHPMAWLMERQLDHGCGRILADTLERTGIRLRLGRYADRYEPGIGLMLDDGSRVRAKLVIIAAGARADTTLAANAGLVVKNGIVVNDSLRTSDARIFAIGDCAQFGDSSSGFVEPAWEQAAVLAELLTQEGATSRYHGSTVVTRLKIPGVDLMSLGGSHGDANTADDEVLCVADPVRGRYAKLVLREDAVERAIMLGFPDAAASLAHYYLHATMVRTDRLSVLAGLARRAEIHLTDKPPFSGRHIVCTCNGVTRQSLVEAWQRGARSTHELADATGAMTGCGVCEAAVSAMADELAALNGKDQSSPCTDG